MNRIVGVGVAVFKVVIHEIGVTLIFTLGEPGEGARSASSLAVCPTRRTCATSDR